MADSKKEILKRIKQRSYLNKDFDSFRSDLLTYKRTFFPNTPQDDSDASFGGFLMDMPSYIGDVLSFYLDHQFFELDPLTSVEPKNVQRHLERSNVPIVGAAPAVVKQQFTFIVPADPLNFNIPDVTAMPKLFTGTRVQSTSGITFSLTEELDFSETNISTGEFKAKFEPANRNASQNPTEYYVTMEGYCISGLYGTESFNVGSVTPFLQYTLSQPNVTEITSVIDNSGNEYYEVEFLTQDTVYKAITNLNSDKEFVKDNFVPIPAPYRFIKRMDVNSKLMTLTFGGSSAETIDDDIIPDPSQFAVPLYGKRIVSRFTINPGNMLQTTTLGSVIPNSTINITYRYGGGLSHNVPVGSIRSISRLDISFPGNPTVSTAQSVRNSAATYNPLNASGGEDSPTLEELKLKIPQYNNSQGRIVSKPDLLARIYTIPSNFGRVYRAAIHPNPNNPLASQIYIISRNENAELIISPDTLKKNLATYINQYRLTSDAIDILDAQVINLNITFKVVVDSSLNKNAVLANTIASLKKYFQNKKFDIDQPLIKSDVYNLIFNNVGIISVDSIEIGNPQNTSSVNASGQPTATRVYSNVQFNVSGNTYKGIIFPPTGGIFELKYPNFDIVGIII